MSPRNRITFLSALLGGAALILAVDGWPDPQARADDALPPMLRLAQMDMTGSHTPSAPAGDDDNFPGRQHRQNDNLLSRIRGLGAKEQEDKAKALAASAKEKPAAPVNQAMVADDDTKLCQPGDAVAVQKLKDEKKKQDDKKKGEIKEVKKKVDKKLTDDKSEQDKRKNVPGRQDAENEQHKLDGQRDDLNKERDRINGLQNQMDQQRNALQQQQNDLRNQEQDARDNGDPYCQGAACQDIQDKRTAANQAMNDFNNSTVNLQKQLAVDQSQYNGANAAWNAQNNDLQNRLDQGYGQTPKELQNRMQAKAEAQNLQNLSQQQDTAKGKLAGLQQTRTDLMNQRIQLTGGFFEPNADDLSKMSPADRAQYNALNQQINAVNNQITPLNNQVSALNGQIDKSQSNLSNLNGQNGFVQYTGTSNQQLSEQVNNLTTASNQLDAASRALDSGQQPAPFDMSSADKLTQAEKDQAKARDNEAKPSLDQGKAEIARDKARGQLGALQNQLQNALNNGASITQINELKTQVGDAQNLVNTTTTNLAIKTNDENRAIDAVNKASAKYGEAQLETSGAAALADISNYNAGYDGLLDDHGNIDQGRAAARINGINGALGGLARGNALIEDLKKPGPAPAGPGGGLVVPGGGVPAGGGSGGCGLQGHNAQQAKEATEAKEAKGYRMPGAKKTRGPSLPGFGPRAPSSPLGGGGKKLALPSGGGSKLSLPGGKKTTGTSPLGFGPRGPSVALGGKKLSPGGSAKNGLVTGQASSPAPLQITPEPDKLTNPRAEVNLGKPKAAGKAGGGNRQEELDAAAKASGRQPDKFINPREEVRFDKKGTPPQAGENPKVAAAEKAGPQPRQPDKFINPLPTIEDLMRGPHRGAIDPKAAALAKAQEDQKKAAETLKKNGINVEFDKDGKAIKLTATGPLGQAVAEASKDMRRRDELRGKQEAAETARKAAEDARKLAAAEAKKAKAKPVEAAKKEGGENKQAAADNNPGKKDGDIVPASLNPAEQKPPQAAVAKTPPPAPLTEDEKKELAGLDAEYEAGKRAVEAGKKRNPGFRLAGNPLQPRGPMPDKFINPLPTLEDLMRPISPEVFEPPPGPDDYKPLHVVKPVPKNIPIAKNARSPFQVLARWFGFGKTSKLKPSSAPMATGPKAQPGPKIAARSSLDPNNLPPGRDDAGAGVPSGNPRTSISDDAQPKGAQEFGKDTVDARAEFAAAAKKQIAATVKDPSELSRELLPKVVAQLADQLGPFEANDLLQAALKREAARPYSDGVSLLQSLFDEVAARAAKIRLADGERTARSAQLAVLQSILLDPNSDRDLNLTPSQMTALEHNRDRLVQALLDEAEHRRNDALKAGDKAGQARALADLAGLYVLAAGKINGGEATIASVAADLARLAPGLDGAKMPPPVLAGLIAVLERVLHTPLPADVRENMVAALADVYRAAGHDALANVPANDPLALADAQSRAAAAMTAEARLRISLSQFDRALAIARAMPQGTPDAEAARATTLAGVIGALEGLTDRLAPQDRAKLGDIAKLHEEKMNALRVLMGLAKDGDSYGAAALDLARSLLAAGRREDALKVLDNGITLHPGNAVLAGARLALNLAGASAADIAAQLKALAQPVRAAALLVALNQLAEDDTPAQLQALADGAKQAEGISDHDRAVINMRIDAAGIAIAGAAAHTAEGDKALAIKIAEAQARLKALDIPDAAKKAQAAEWDRLAGQLKDAQGWRAALASGKPPQMGYDGMAALALQTGQLEIAAQAVLKEFERSLVSGSREELIRAASEALQKMKLVRQRMELPGVSAQGRQVAQAFLDRVAGGLLPRLGDLLGEGVVMSGRAGAVNSQLAQQVADETAQQSALDQAKLNQFKLLDELRQLSRLRLMVQLAAKPRVAAAGEIQRETGGAVQQILRKQAELEKLFPGERDAVMTGDKRTALDTRLGELDGLRAISDGIADFELVVSPKTDTGKSSREAAIDSIERNENGFTGFKHWTNSDDDKEWWRQSARYRLGLDENHKKIKGPSDAWRDALIHRNEVDYLERRRAQLIMEDPAKTLEQRRQARTARYEAEAATFKDWGEFYFLGNIGLGAHDLAMSRALLAQADELRRGWARQDFENALAANDVQKFFRAVVTLREIALTDQISAYADFFDDDWATRGPFKGLKQVRSGDKQKTQALLDAANAEAAKLHPALIRASYRRIGELSDEDRTLLESYGYIKNGKLVIPDTDPNALVTVTTAGTEFAAQNWFARSFDSVVNAKQAAILAVTVVLPGVAAGGLTTGLLLEGGLGGGLRAALAQESWGAVAWGVGRTGILWGSERALEAAIFTGLSRGANVLLDPSILQDEKAWSVTSLGGEYLSNLAVIATLGVANEGMQSVRAALTRRLGNRIQGALAYELFRGVTGAGMMVGEAGVMTGLDAGLHHNTFTREGFITNLATIGMLKAAHGGAPDDHSNSNMADYKRFHYLQMRAEMKAMMVHEPAGKLLVERFGGSWDAARKAFKNGQLSKGEMESLIKLRGQVIDSLIAGVLWEVGGEAKALGTVSPTSDYDLSFYGPRAELAVIIFNARFAAEWGVAAGFGGTPSAIRFDTNVYTQANYEYLQASKSDRGTQDLYSQLAARRNRDVEHWKHHREITLQNTPAAERAAMQATLDKADALYLANEQTVKATKPQVAKELGKAENSPDVETETRLRLYHEYLRNVIEARQRDAALARGPPSDAVAAERAKLAQYMRDQQGLALYFASEAYLTGASIDLVVNYTQAIGRIIDRAWLYGGPSSLKLEVPAWVARQSFLEQTAYIMEYVHLGGATDSLATKLGKYFIRGYDAARFARIDLKPLSGNVDLTVAIDSYRNNPDWIRSRLAIDAMMRHLVEEATGAHGADAETLKTRIGAAEKQIQILDERARNKPDDAAKAQIGKGLDALVAELVRDTKMDPKQAAEEGGKAYIESTLKAIDYLTAKFAAITDDRPAEAPPQPPSAATIAPPQPRDMGHEIFQNWESGRSLRDAARQAGVAPDRARALLDGYLRDRWDISDPKERTRLVDAWANGPQTVRLEAVDFAEVKKESLPKTAVAEELHFGKPVDLSDPELQWAIAADWSNNKSIAEVAKARGISAADVKSLLARDLENNGADAAQRAQLIADWENGKKLPVRAPIAQVPIPVQPAVLSGEWLAPGENNPLGKPSKEGFKELAGKTVKLPPADNGFDPGTITLGRRYGDESAFGYVYAIEGQSERVLKIIHKPGGGTTGGGPASVARQLHGYRTIAGFDDIPTARIIASHVGGPNEASYLILENLTTGRWAGKNVQIGPGGKLTPLQLAAAHELYNRMVQHGVFCGDCHQGNLFFFDDTDAAGNKVVRAGIVDHDLILRYDEMVGVDPALDEQLFAQVMGKGHDGLQLLGGTVTGANPGLDRLMASFFDIKISDAQQ